MAPSKPKSSEIPNAPGVYFFRGKGDRVVYVGKAKSLRHRVPAYFGAIDSIRTAAMIEEATRVEWIVTANEIEALQLEVSLIKEHRPRFNVRYRDDKSYPYLAVTLGEEVPRAMVTRTKRKKGNRYFGPYAHAYAIRETLDLLLRVFPIRSCSDGVFNRARAAGRPCLLFHIDKCAGPCVEAIGLDEHRELVGRLCEFLDGDHDRIVKELEEEMSESAEVQEYERAARLRDRLSAVHKVISRQEMVVEGRGNLDVVSMASDDLEAAFQMFMVRGGRVVGRKGYLVDRVEEMGEDGLAASFIENLYGDGGEVPPEILSPVMPLAPETLEAWLSEMRGARVRIHVPQRGAKRRLMETVTRNAQEAFQRSRMKRASDFAARSRALNELQEHLGLPESPLRIECFDVSNLGPTEVVGSMVVFEDALPKKSDYRKFKIRGIEGQDDVAAMGELLERRFRRYQSEKQTTPTKDSRFAYRPGLVLLDGGKGQLKRGTDVLRSLGLEDLPIAALAKRFEEIHLPYEDSPRVLPRGSEALYLLQRIRDEAHRFAVTFQRERRKRGVTSSLLDDLAGVGPARKKALLRRFGSLKKLREASAEEIAQVPGVGPRLSRDIYEYLRDGSRR